MSKIDDRTLLVAQRIRAARRDRGLTLAQLAEQLPEYGPALSGAQLSRVELGQRQLSISELSGIASALSMVPEYLMRAGELCGTCGQELINV